MTGTDISIQNVMPGFSFLSGTVTSPDFTETMAKNITIIKIIATYRKSDVIN